MPTSTMLYRCLGFTYCLLHISAAHASGLFVDPQQGAGVGYAFAGQAALTRDASTALFNPAGTMWLSPKQEGVHLSGSLAFVDIQTKFQDQGSNKPDSRIPVGASQSTMKSSLVIPAVHAAYVDQSWALGFSVSPMYGADGEWDSQFAGRYQGRKTDIKAIHVSPSYALRINPTLSIGAGIDYLNAEATLTRNLPIIWKNGSYLGDTLESLAGDGDGFGGNVGLLWVPTTDLHVGLTYRSQIDMNLKGDLTKTAPTPAGDMVTITQTDVDLSAPQSVSLSGTYQFDPSLTLLGDVSWYDWSVIASMTAKNRSTGVVEYQEALNFKDGWRVSAGALYTLSPALELRAGIAYDGSVVKNDQSRNVRFPDADRVWLSVGAGYHLTPNSSVDVGYTHVLTNEANIDRQTSFAVPTAQQLKGRFDSSANLLSVQLNTHF